MEFIRPKEDGTVEVVLISKVVTLRRPKFGEYRALREKLEDSEDEAVNLGTELGRLLDRANNLDAEARLGEEAEILGNEIRKKNREVRDASERIRVEFLTSVLETLDKKSDPVDVDDFPTEVAGNWINPLIAHWRNRPLVSGES